MDELELRNVGKTFLIGEDLYGVSVKQLQQRIEILKAELIRIDASIGKKQAELSAAEGFFNKP